MSNKALIAILLSSSVLSVSAADTVPGTHAEKNGFRSCQKTVDDIAKFVVKDKKHSSMSTWNKKATDTRMFNSQVAIKYSDGNSIAILNIAPTKSGKCDSSYTTVTTFDKSCAALRETDLSTWKFAGELSGLVTLENESGAVSIILLPADTGCALIKTETVYE